MLAGRVAHHCVPFLFHAFCNNGLDDAAKGVVSEEFLNFILFSVSMPFKWLTDPAYLRGLLSEASVSSSYYQTFEYYTRDISREDLEFYYMTNDRAYRSGDTLFFTTGHKPHEYAAYYCTCGLLAYNISEVGTWSDGDCTEFEFDVADSDNTPLRLFIGLASECPAAYDPVSATQTVSFTVNERDCGSVTLVPGMVAFDFIIPEDIYTNKLRIKLSYGYTQTNAEQKIAVLFERMRISPGAEIKPDEKAMLEVSKLVKVKSDLEEHNRQVSIQNEWLNSTLDSVYRSKSWRVGNKIMRTAKRFRNLGK